jgi:hypothetical protein
VTKRPLFLIDCQGKTLQEIQAEAWEAIQRYRDALQADATDYATENDDENDCGTDDSDDA